jgi:hypothetical protein
LNCEPNVLGVTESIIEVYKRKPIGPIEDSGAGAG